MKRSALTILAFSLVSIVHVSDASAGDIVFPWHSSNPAPVGRVPARILAKPATTPLEILVPSKQPYPYGWFGPNPAPQWKRSFGGAKNYTQWSRM